MPLGFARALVRAAELDAAIDLLESDDPPLRDDLELRGRTLGALRSRVAGMGDELVRAAVAVALHGEPEDRRRAQLLLAQQPRLPGWAGAALEASPGFEAWALAQLTRRRRADYLIDLRRGDPQEAGWPGKAAIRQVEGDLARRIAYDDAQLAGCNEEYLEDYRTIALPRMADLSEALPWDAWIGADLDGDGDPECVVACDFWAGTGTGWHDELSFVALLDRFDAQARWRIAAFERLETGEAPVEMLVRDFDRDGRAEVAVRSERRGGPFGAVRIVAAGATAPLPRLVAWNPVQRIVLLERSAEEPVRFVSSAWHLPNLTGKSQELIGTMAARRETFLWNGRAFEPAETLYTSMW